MYISDLDTTGIDRSGAILKYDDTSGTDRATIYLPGPATGGNVSISVTGAITDNTTWLTIPVSFTSGGLPANNENRNVIGVRNGLQGLQGLSNQGTQGTQGLSSQGIQGTQGLSNQGIQGVQGLKGDSGSGGSGSVSISTNTTNTNQLIPYVTSFGSTTGFGATTSLVYNPASGGGITISGGNINVNDGIVVIGSSGYLDVPNIIYSAGYTTINSIIFGRSGSNNIFFGDNATLNLSFITGNSNTGIGDVSGGSLQSGSFNTLIGNSSGYSIIGGNLNIALGYGANAYNNGNNNIFIGNISGDISTSSNKIIIGSGSTDGLSTFDAPDTAKNTQLAIGIRTNANPSKYWLVGDENFNVGIGTTNPISKLTVFGDSRITGITTSGYLDGNPINTLSGSILAYSYRMAMP
jgi:hypothetical protein